MRRSGGANIHVLPIPDCRRPIRNHYLRIKSHYHPDQQLQLPKTFSIELQVPVLILDFLDAISKTYELCPCYEGHNM